MVLRKRLRRSGTISLTSPLARVSIDSRRRVAAPLGPAPARHVGVTGKVRTAHPRPRTGLADTPSQLRFPPPGGSLPTHNIGLCADANCSGRGLVHLQRVRVPPGMVLKVMGGDEVEHRPRRTVHQLLGAHNRQGNRRSSAR